MILMMVAQFLLDTLEALRIKWITHGAETSLKRHCCHHEIIEGIPLQAFMKGILITGNGEVGSKC